MIKPDPPASLADTREAIERMDARGNTLVAVDREQVAATIKRSRGLRRRVAHDQPRSTATSTAATSRRSPTSSKRSIPGFPVTMSSAVLPEFREYERTLTACMNSYVRPQVARYVDSLQTQLHGLGLTSDVDILRSDAGVMTPREAARNPVYGVLSAARPAASRARSTWPHAPAIPNVLTFDMGGTCTDVSLCQAGEPTIGRETTIGQFRIKVPSVDVHTVGAGGGWIAHVPELTGALRVGPQSAGAEPGPAAYGHGGEQPTVTDANVVLGKLPANLIGGEMTLDVEAAKAAVQKVADAMGLSLEQAADGILKIVNENMAGALRVISVQRGHDPREFALVAFGGAGPLHANAVAELMGSFPVIVPPSPGLLCALGDLVAGFRNEFAQTLIRLTDEATDEELQAIVAELESRARAWMDAEGIPKDAQHVEFVADMRYRGQGYEIPVPMGGGARRALQRAARAAVRLPDAEHGVGDRQPARRRHRRPPAARAARGRAARPPRSQPGTHDRADLHPGTHHPRAVDRHRVRLHHGDPRRLRGRDRPLLQPADPPEAENGLPRGMS